MLKRRLFIASLLAILAQGARGQAAKRRIAVLTGGDAVSIPQAMRTALRTALGAAGFVEGSNLALEWHYAQEHPERLRELANEIARSKPDAIVAINTPAALAAKRATTTTPIVFLRVADPVGVGLVATLARPAGNATGFMPFTPELAGKRLAILKQALPGITKVAVLYMRTNPGAALTYRQMAEAASKVELTVQDAGVKSTAELAPAIGAAARDGAGAVMLVDDVVLAANKPAIVEGSLKHRLAVGSIYRDFAESGALMAYGPNPEEMYAGASNYAARILRGAHPGDLPVQQPARFELVVNLKTAAALGLRLPPAFLANADTVLR